jgi:hypothetical protein
MAFKDDRARKDYEEFIRQDDLEQQKLADKLMAPIRAQKAKEEFERTANAAATFQRRVSLGLNEHAWIDPDKPYIDPNDEAAIAEYNGKSGGEFADEYLSKGWYPSERNKDILLDFFWNRGIHQISAREFAAAFKAIKREPGIFEEKPIPVQHVPVAPVQQEDIQPDWNALPRLPIDHKTPIATKRDIDQPQMGIDPNTGKQRLYSDFEISNMSAEVYKRIFQIPTTHLGKYSFGGGR